MAKKQATFQFCIFTFILSVFILLSFFNFVMAAESAASNNAFSSDCFGAKLCDALPPEEATSKLKFHLEAKCNAIAFGGETITVQSKEGCFYDVAGGEAAQTDGETSNDPETNGITGPFIGAKLLPVKECASSDAEACGNSCVASNEGRCSRAWYDANKNNWLPEPKQWTFDYNTGPSHPMPLPKARWRHVSYEGQCHVEAEMEHTRYDRGVECEIFGPEKFTGMEYTVNWDHNQEDCAFTGEWKQGYGCCGDDYAWLHNKFYGDLGSHEAYDTETLGRDDAYSDSRSWPKGEKDDPFYFIGRGGREIDIGKYTGPEGPLYCDFEGTFINQHGMTDYKYAWKTLPEVADKNVDVCEIQLGYTWTGTKCCGVEGAKGKTYNDPKKECDVDEIGPEATTPQWTIDLNKFNSLCNKQLVKNTACWNNEVIDNNTIFSSEKGYNDIVQYEGVFYGCKHADGTKPVSLSGSDNIDKCEMKGDNICAYKNDSWYHLDISENSGAYSILHFRGNKATMKLSKLPELEFDSNITQTQECCFSGSCWDGHKCANEYSVYKYLNKNFVYFDYSEWPTYKETDVLYQCYNGEWTKIKKPKYNWDYNTDSPAFCIHDNTCACSSATESNHGCGSYANNGCTNTTDVFVKDHYCEINNGYGRWTSRTKYLAMQMISIAGNNDYALFCDDYKNSINDYFYLDSLKDRINSVCVLAYNGKTVLGFTFNSLNRTKSMTMDIKKEVVFNNVSGLIDALKENTTQESDCTISEASEQFPGTFRACSGRKLFLNNKLKAAIYSKEGLDQDVLSVSDLSSLKDFFNNEESKMKGFVLNNQETLETTEYNIYPIRFLSNFNRLYINKLSQKNFFVFGVDETKYDSQVKGLRNIIIIDFNSFDPGCDAIEKAYSSTGITARCIEDNGNFYVVDRYDPVTEKTYWRDLTSKLRTTEPATT